MTGSAHPVHAAAGLVLDVLVRLGFRRYDGPEVELDRHNYERLGYPPGHLARDTQEPYWVRVPSGAPEHAPLLRTHTSSVLTRVLDQWGAPLRMVSVGRVYRRKEGPTHSPMFHQLEALWVEPGLSLAHLRGLLRACLDPLFGQAPTRLRIAHFPFVEPGLELDLGCTACARRGCPVCKGSGWLELLGAGMIRPELLSASGIDAERHRGVAFGLGLDRAAMLREGIDDLRLLFDGRGGGARCRG